MKTATLLAVLLGSVVLVRLCSADELIGTLPDIGGTPPPISQGDSLESPTRFIRFSSDRTPNIHGYDYPVSSCEGHVFHVTADCRINGVSISPWRHYYTLNYAGQCVEVYSWKGMVVDLGQPGAFTIDLAGDNSLGIGVVAMYDWEIWSVDDIADVAEDHLAIPLARTELFQNTPNPFHRMTKIRYNLSRAGHASVRILDARGRCVRTLAQGIQQAGPHQITWCGADSEGCVASPGIYFIRLEAGSQVATRKVVLVR
ncbi:MAG: FlgD immunoglobulin-like domain containing protein [Candidatus Eisenbacteria bacterium]